MEKVLIWHATFRKALVVVEVLPWPCKAHMHQEDPTNSSSFIVCSETLSHSASNMFWRQTSAALVSAMSCVPKLHRELPASSLKNFQFVVEQYMGIIYHSTNTANLHEDKKCLYQ